MFLRKDIKKVETGKVLVPFCKNCNSQNIKTIRICKDCGSHNVTSDWMDERSTKTEYAEKEIYVFKCDCCNKEFNGFTIDKFISYNECGEFVPFRATDDHGNDVGTSFDLEMDLCEECKLVIVDKLNRELDNISRKEHVSSILEEVITNKNLKKEIE